MTHDIRPARMADLDELVALFDAYRIFYEQESDRNGAELFLRDRFSRMDSQIFVAEADGRRLVGFVQLYPSHSSVVMRPIVILNDLFVAPEARRTGVARKLMAAAEAHARETGAIRLSLSTAVDNTKAQALYEDEGYERDVAFYAYHRRLE